MRFARVLHLTRLARRTKALVCVLPCQPSEHALRRCGSLLADTHPFRNRKP